MKISEFITIFESKFPKELAVKDDPIGFQIGDLNQDITNIVFALELSQEVIDFAITHDSNFIFVHHPFIYVPIRNIIAQTYQGKLIQQLIKQDICVYAAHTNLDIGDHGVNDSLCELLHIKDYIKISDKDDYEFMRVGNVREQSMKEYLSFVKAQLKIENIRFIGDINATVKKVGIIGGAGAYDFKDAMNNGCDLYLSGDITHHVAEEVHNLGFNACDISHNAEKYYIPNLIQLLEAHLDGITCFPYYNEDYYQIIA